VEGRFWGRVERNNLRAWTQKDEARKRSDVEKGLGRGGPFWDDGSVEQIKILDWEGVGFHVGGVKFLQIDIWKLHPVCGKELGEKKREVGGKINYAPE